MCEFLGNGLGTWYGFTHLSVPDPGRFFLQNCGCCTGRSLYGVQSVQLFECVIVLKMNEKSQLLPHDDVISSSPGYSLSH